MRVSQLVALCSPLSILAGCVNTSQQCMTIRTINQDGSKAGMPFVRYIIKTQEGQLYRGVTNQYEFNDAVPTGYPDGARVEFPESVSKVPFEQRPSIHTTPSPSVESGEST